MTERKLKYIHEHREMTELQRGMYYTFSTDLCSWRILNAVWTNDGRISQPFMFFYGYNQYSMEMCQGAMVRLNKRYFKIQNIV